VPSIEIDGTSTMVMHISQLARLLHLPVPAMPEASRLAYDLLLVVGFWTSLIRPLPFELLVADTESRGRSIRNLTMNAVYPISLLPDAYETGKFDWGLVDMDEKLARQYEDTRSLVEFAQSVHDGWGLFVAAYENDLAKHDPWIDAPRGRMRFSELLGHQRWHLSFHYRQIGEFLASRGRPVPDGLRLDAAVAIALPPSVF